MSELIDKLLDLIINGSADALPNKKYARWFRLIAILIPIIVMIGIVIAGIFTIRTNLLGGVVITIIGTVLLIILLVKIRKVIKRNTKKK